MTFSLRRFFRDGSVLFASGIGVAFLSFFQGIMIARGLGPEGYGTWGAVLASIDVSKNLLSFRTKEPLTRYLVDLRKRDHQSRVKLILSTALLTDFCTSILAFLLILCASPWLASEVAGGVSALYIYWLYGLTILLKFVDSTWFCVARDRKQYGFISSLPVGATTIRFLFISVIWFTENITLINVALVYLFVVGGTFIIKVFTLRNNVYQAYGILMRRLPLYRCWTDRSVLNSFWSFMGTTYASSVFSSIVKNGDILILGYYSTQSDIGIYRLAKRMSSSIKNVSVSLTKVIYQDLNEMISDKQIQSVKRSLTRISKVWVPLIVAGVVFSLLIAESVIQLVYGSQYEAAAWPFQILIVGTGTAMSLFWSQSLLLAFDGYRANLIIIVTVSVISLGLMGILTPVAGPIGMAVAVAFSWAAGYIATSLTALTRLKRATTQDN